jgi:hypothetical protein
MISLPSFLTLAHLIGLALGVGAATVKVTLLLQTRADPGLVPVYIKVARPITRLIVIGLILLTLSGIGWLLVGYQLTTTLWVKLALVAAIWVLGPIIDNVAEPRFRKLAPATGVTPSPEFLRTRRRYLTLELTATGLFYAITVFWVLA